MIGGVVDYARTDPTTIDIVIVVLQVGDSFGDLVDRD